MKRAIQIFLVALICTATVAQRSSYHPQPKKLPPVLKEEQLGPAAKSYQRQAYRLAAVQSELVAQLPCMCHCERMGHRSLHSCFESLHAADCYVCMKEVFYAEMEQKTGKTAAQIRDGILRGEHNRIQIDEETGSVWR